MKTNKVLYGMLAFGPMILVFIGMAVLIVGMRDMGMLDDGAAIDPNVGVFLAFMGLMLLVGILGIISMIMFILHISKNKNVPEDQRIYWIIGIVLANGITNILYFFIYIMREDEFPTPQSRPQPPVDPWK